MEKRIRFALDPDTPPTARQALHGILEGDIVYQTESLWASQRGRAHPFAKVRLLPPCFPSKIVCVGRNYGDHAKELGNVVPAEPLIFLKPPSSLVASGDPIVYPAITQHLSYEGELAAVIGKRARRVLAADADEFILGYTCLNDVTARDLQKQDQQWARAKGCDTFCPVGPWIVPRSEVAFESLRVRTFVDGEKKQDAPVLDMIFSVGAIIEYVTAFMTLEPGDLLATGTPSGVGRLSVGSVVRVDIEGIGVLENRVIR